MTIDKNSTPLLKPADVARILNISKSAACRLLKGEIKAVRFGGIVRVSQDELDKFIAEHKTPPNPSNGSFVPGKANA